MVECNADIFASLLDDDDDLCVSKDKLKELENKYAHAGTLNNDVPSIGVNECRSDIPNYVENLGTNCLKEKKLNYDIDIFSELDKDSSALPLSVEKSIVHTNDTDSSDDEENKYFENSKYNSFGKGIKNQLKQQQQNITDDSKKSFRCSKINSVPSNKKQISLPEKLPTKKNDVYSDPIFGIRIINPLISSMSLQMKMDGKVAVSLAKLKIQLNKNGSKDEDWVLAGVIVKTVTKTSQNGNQYIIWDVSDLKEQLLSVPIFLFGRSYTALWKTTVGSVIGILNPSCSKKENQNTISLTINHPDQVMIWGTSKDFAFCRAMKKNGEKCNSFVNRSTCEFCVYHVKQEYRKYSSSRSDLQSPYGERDSLRNKVLGKNEVFYGGKSYTAVKQALPKRVKQVSAKDTKRLTQLGFTVMEKVDQPEPSSGGPPQFSRGSQVMKQLANAKQISSFSSPVSTPNPNVKFVKPSPNELKFRSLSDKNSSNGVLNKLSSKTTPAYGENIIKKSPAVVDKQETDSVSPSVNKKKLSFLNSTGNSPSTSNKVSNNKGPTITDPNSFEKDNVCFLDQVSTENPLTDNLKSSLTENAFTNKPNLTDPVNRNASPPCDSKLKISFPKPSLSDPNSKKKAEKKIQSKSVPAPVNPLQKKFNSLFEFTPLKKEKQSNCLTTNSDLQTETSQQPSEPQGAINNIKNNCDAVSKLNSSPPVFPESKKINDPSPQDSVNPRSVHSMRSASQCSDIASPSSIVSPRSVSGMRSASQSPNIASPSSIHSRKMTSAKLRAIQVIKAQGVAPQKRKREIIKSDEQTDEKEKPVFSELFLELMKKTTAHLDLVEIERLRKEEEYFERMGKKEALEEKMLNTFKVDCKAVKCLKCKYIWFSSSEICKSEGHPIKVVDAVKRFFKCGNCGHRTVSLHILPLVSCKQCHQTNWLRAPMIREKITKNASQLSIRGGEQTFIHSSITNGNINLLVPDENM